MANKNGRKILISLLVGIIVACLSLNTFSDMQKKIREQDQLITVMKQYTEELNGKKHMYITAARNMEAGETVTENDIKITAFDEEQNDAISSKDMVIGNVLLEAVKAGQVLTGYVFTGVLQDGQNLDLRDGYRALTLSTATLDGMSKDMKTGSLIDVFSKGKDSFVLSKVKILSLEPAEEKQDNKENANISITQAKSVTFEVPIDKIQDLVEIYSSGKILLVMRPIGDDSVITTTARKKSNENTARSSGVNYNYGPEPLPPMPQVEAYDNVPPADVNQLPAPVQVKKSTKSVELIEANNKTQVSFD